MCILLCAWAYDIHKTQSNTASLGIWQADFTSLPTPALLLKLRPVSEVEMNFIWVCNQEETRYKRIHTIKHAIPYTMHITNTNYIKAMHCHIACFACKSTRITCVTFVTCTHPCHTTCTPCPSFPLLKMAPVLNCCVDLLFTFKAQRTIWEMTCLSGSRVSSSGSSPA